jgi:hypothetical protein
MPCDYTYEAQPSREDVLNQRRNEDLARIEQELALGTAHLTIDPATGNTKLEGASVWPSGMQDACVLAALAERNSVEWQLAAAHAGVQERSFVTEHAFAHTHGLAHKH